MLSMLFLVPIFDYYWAEIDENIQLSPTNNAVATK